MPKLLTAVPKYSLHRASGQAVVCLAGHDHYLGPWKSLASRLEYDRLIAEWIAAGRPSHKVDAPSGLLVGELIIRFWRHAETYYRKHGRPTGTAENFRYALRFLRKLYGHTLVTDFGPLALKAVRQKMVEADHSRVYVNQNIERIRQMFRWGASEELVPASVYEALKTVAGLPKGRGLVRETEPVMPVDDAVVEATLPHLSTVVQSMIRLQRLTGARPGEICILRPCDIEQQGDVWWFTPAEHKVEHHSRRRAIPLGLRAQQILQPYLQRQPDAYCFSPADAEAEVRARRSAARKTPLRQGNRPGTNRKLQPGRRPQLHYTGASYRRAIHRACDLAFPAPEILSEKDKKKWASEHRWSPNRLRHAVATEIRKQFGLEAAAVVLGHASPDVTLIYAEKDMEHAATVMRAIG